MPRTFRAKNLSVKVGAQGGPRCMALTCQLDTTCHHTRVVNCHFVTLCGFTSYTNGTGIRCLIAACQLATNIETQTFAEQLDGLKAELQDAIKVVDAQRKELSGGPARKRPRRRAKK